jgi:hypothetical protein
MLGSVKKEIGAVCAELGELLEKPHTPVNATTLQLINIIQWLINMV